MIFLTVGHQSPFDRLVRCVDGWAAENPHYPVFAQIGEGSYQPQHMKWSRWLTPLEFNSKLDECVGVVAHAGTGTIIEVLLRPKPLLVFPRLADLGETRNDHQVGTARHFSEHGYLVAAYNEEMLEARMTSIAQQAAQRSVGNVASPELLARITAFVEDVAHSKYARP